MTDSAELEKIKTVTRLIIDSRHKNKVIEKLAVDLYYACESNFGTPRRLSRRSGDTILTWVKLAIHVLDSDSEPLRVTLPGVGFLSRLDADSPWRFWPMCDEIVFEGNTIKQETAGLFLPQIQAVEPDGSEFVVQKTESLARKTYFEFAIPPASHTHVFDMLRAAFDLGFASTSDVYNGKYPVDAALSEVHVERRDYQLRQMLTNMAVPNDH